MSIAGSVTTTAAPKRIAPRMLRKAKPLGGQAENNLRQRRSWTDMQSNVALYWAQFIESLPPTVGRLMQCSGSDYFGFTPEDARVISELVRAGSKTATGSLLWSYEFDGKPVPRVGDYWIVTNGNDDPVCVVQTTQVRVVPFDEVTADYARYGGEGDLSLESWRGIYWRLIVSECARVQRTPSKKVPLVMERFRVVYSEPFLYNQHLSAPDHPWITQTIGKG